MSSSLTLALQDLWQGIIAWRVWLLFGWQDIRIRYRRSLLGPFWISLSMAIIVASMGFLYSHLFKMDLRHYLPFLAGGMLAWSFISTMICESPVVFVEANPFVKQVKIPYSVFLMRMITRNFIIFLHNLLIVVIIILFLKVSINVSIISILLGLMIIMGSAFFVGLLVGTLNARYRDFNPIVSSFVQICFFLSPIMWPAENLPPRYAFFVKYNPVAQYVSLIRDPLLGHWPSFHAYALTITTMLVFAFASLALFVRCRRRLIFWL
ncbi:MAG: ABC transporter permease [Gammaproteobacteria bacterium]|nr:ABC transporter permease [Gammaproteobacteria bacterium]